MRFFSFLLDSSFFPYLVTLLSYRSLPLSSAGRDERDRDPLDRGDSLHQEFKPPLTF